MLRKGVKPSVDLLVNSWICILISARRALIHAGDSNRLSSNADAGFWRFLATLLCTAFGRSFAYPDFRGRKHSDTGTYKYFRNTLYVPPQFPVFGE